MFARPTWKTKELRLALGAAVAATTCLAGPWPEVIDLDVGEFCEVPTRKGPVRVMLLGVSEKTEPDYFIPANPRRTTIVGAEAELAVGDQRARVIGRPYQFPVVINGVRIYLESTRFWAQAAVAPLADLKKAVRVSVLDAAEPWGPQDLVFPIENYRWRSASYNNTWGSLVPGNLLYYHRGEDLGAIPDRLPVVAIFGGTVVRTPLTHGKPVGSNHVAIESEDRVVALYSHINYEHLAPELVPGATIKAGQVIGRTGSTWNGGRNQRSDPHLHVGLHRPLGELPDALFPARSSGYPMLVDAYFRKYPDAVLAIAGGCRFAVPGDLIELDATRSVVRPGEEIASCEWRLHDGTRVVAPHARIRCEAPGLYSEELIVRTKSGAEDRDFLQLRVYEPNRPVGDIAFGWLYHSPVRGIRPGTSVLFWNRLRPRTDAPVWIDFGDGSRPKQIEAECEHAYVQSGLYTVRLSTTGPRAEPVAIQMRVVVER